ncbi:LysR family transcriptional regulator [bacterium]|nr:LysR family transcriptional regulator [bacterium]
MEMHQIKYFLAVTRTLNFTRAADQCNVTQPSLTRAIQKLEDEFGGLLFNRERSLTHLTELGRMVLPHLEQTYEAAEAAASLASSLGRAEVTPLVIGIARGLQSRALGEVLAAVARALPGLTLDLRNGTSEHLIEAALKGGIDLLLIALPETLHERLETWPLYQQRYEMATWADDGAPRPAAAEAAGRIWLDCADDATALWRAVAGRLGLAPEFRHRVAGPDLAPDLVALRLGHAILPEGTQAPGLRMVGFRDLELCQTIGLAAVAGRRRGRAAEAVVRAARARAWQSEPEALAITP